MSETQNLLETLSQIETINDLKAALPPTLTEELGRGEDGVSKTMLLLEGISTFGVAPLSFDRPAFDDVIAYDEEKREPFPPEYAQKMFDLALKWSLITSTPDDPKQYFADPCFEPLYQKIFSKIE